MDSPTFLQGSFHNRDDSLYKPLGNAGDGRFTLESILESPATNKGTDERDVYYSHANVVRYSGNF
jgi:hypothetical protein